MKIVNSKYESLRSNKKKLKRIIKYRRCDDGLKRKARGRRKARISCRTRVVVFAGPTSCAHENCVRQTGAVA